jgi:hypothetical protein
MINVKNMPKNFERKVLIGHLFKNLQLKIFLLIIGTFSLASGTFSATIVMNRL